jgi:DNA-binding NtrC family response regulator
MSADLIRDHAQYGSDAELTAIARPEDLRVTDAFVIDDEVGICNFVSMTLATLGLVTESYHTAEGAIAALERGQPEIIFLDIALEKSDAVDVIRKLGERHYSGIVQLMSGNKSSLLDDVHRVGAFHGLNMSPPLEKPFRKDAIRRAVERLPLLHRPEIGIVRARD